MFLNVRHVAQTNGVDVEALVEYAKGNNTKFGIVSNGGINCSYIVQYFVHEKNAENLVDSFRNSTIMVIADVEQECFKMQVNQKGNYLFDVVVDGVVRHPDCDALAVIRALSHYLNSYTYSYDKLMKKIVE